MSLKKKFEWCLKKGKGKKERYSDAFLVEKQLNNLIFIKDLTPKYKKEAEKLTKILGTGESAVIALATQEHANLLLIDNLEPRKIAGLKKIKCRSTPGVLLEALNKKMISFKEYENAIKELARYAWLSGDIVAYLLEEGYRLKEDER